MDLNHLFSADETDEHNHCSTMQLFIKLNVNFFLIVPTQELLSKNMQNNKLMQFDQSLWMETPALVDPNNPIVYNPPLIIKKISDVMVDIMTNEYRLC